MATSVVDEGLCLSLVIHKPSAGGALVDNYFPSKSLRNFFRSATAW